MDLELQGRLALVTGSTAGIGLAIAAALAREGARVGVNGRTEERVRAALEELRAVAPTAELLGLTADLGTPEGASTALSAFPEVDILVNNLGVYDPTPFEQLTDEDWLRIIGINFFSGLRLARHHLPRMLARKGGRIIFISSESALNIPTEMIHYGVTKTMQVALARGLAELTAGTAVTVNSILAGPTRSEGVERFINELAESGGRTSEEVERDFFRTSRPGSLLQRFATPNEIASLVAYVASPRSAATNGAALRAEGGLLRTPF